jgi:cysteine desulfurase family protein (TIGR01976 family)
LINILAWLKNVTKLIRGKHMKLEVKQCSAIARARSSFPSLNKVGSNLKQAIFFDNAACSQVPNEVICAVSDHFREGVFNVGADFISSIYAEDVVQKARFAIATLIGAEDENEIILSCNMTTATQLIAQSITRHWVCGDEIILSDIDHAANRSFWQKQAEDIGAVVHYIPLNDDKTNLDFGAYKRLLNDRTVFVAFSAASNLIGSINTDITSMIELAKEFNADVFIDAVHLLPHKRVNVADLGCDYLAGSMYKVFGPQTGFVYGKLSKLKTLAPINVEPASKDMPTCFEPGTLNFPNLNGVIHAVKYLSSLSQNSELSDNKLDLTYQIIADHEKQLSESFISQVKEIDGVYLHGLATSDTHLRTPTFALSFDNISPKVISEYMAAHSVYVRCGHMYAERAVKSMGVKSEAGLLRVSLLHYNTTAEVDRFCKLLENVLHNPPGCLRATYTTF